MDNLYGQPVTGIEIGHLQEDGRTLVSVRGGEVSGSGPVAPLAGGVSRRFAEGIPAGALRTAD